MNESYNTSNNLRLILSQFIKKTGTHNGGDCAAIAKFIEDYLTSIDAYDYSFSGELTDGAVGHILVKFRGRYYDGVEGVVNTSGRSIVDNLKDNGSCIGNNEYGWINYKFGSSNFRTSKDYKIFDSISTQVEDNS
jgi:hypothetical protein